MRMGYEYFLGIAVCILSTILASLNIIKNIIGPKFIVRMRWHLLPATISFLVFFGFFLYKIFTIDGFAYDGYMSEVFMAPNKYFLNLIEMTWV